MKSPLNDLGAIFLLVVCSVWLIGAIGLFVYAVFTSWSYGRKRQDSQTDPTHDVVHDGSNMVAGLLACMMWPLILPMALYEYIRYHR